MENTIALLIFILIGFLPIILAFIRGHESRWGIAIMTVFLGWTGIFWLWALIWSVSAKGGSQNTINNIRNG